MYVDIVFRHASGAKAAPAALNTKEMLLLQSRFGFLTCPTSFHTRPAAVFLFLCFFSSTERPASLDPGLQVQDRDRAHRHLRRHLEDHRGRADPQLDVGGGQGVLLQDEG